MHDITYIRSLDQTDKRCAYGRNNYCYQINPWKIANAIKALLSSSRAEDSTDINIYLHTLLHANKVLDGVIG